MKTPESQKCKFGVFEADLATGELRKAGIKVKLQDQPFQILCALLERPGEIVSREDLRQRIWRNETFVDFDQGLSKAVNKIREALGDSADNPRFVETLARRGYRFIAPVERELCTPAMLAGSSSVAGPKQAPESRRRYWVWLAASGVVPAIVLSIGLWPIAVPRVVDVVQLTNDGTYKGSYVSDGVSVHYGYEGRDVWSVPVSGGEPRRMPLPFLPDGRTRIRVSGYAPMGQQILFLSAGIGDSMAELWLAGPAGDAARKVGELPSVDSVALSPDANRLAISLADGIYIQSIATGERRKVLPMKPPAAVWWHPSGHRIGFLDGRGEDSKLRAWQVNDDGAHLGRIVPEREQMQGRGTWSLDGKRFFYSSIEEGARSIEVFVRTEPGILGWLRRPVVTRLTAAGGQFKGRPAIDPVTPKRLYVAGWSTRVETMRYDRKTRNWVPFLEGFPGDQIDRSPDGQWLVYRKFPGDELHKCRVDGSGDLRLAGSVIAINPRWSPDGRRIAFAGARSSMTRKFGLWLVSAGGGDAAPYRSEIDFGYDAIWSKDGKRILFAQGGNSSKALPAGESRVRILDLDTGKTQTIPKSENLFSPRWSPDEKQLLAVDLRDAHVYIFNAGKSEWKELTKVVSAYPTWSADGKWIYAFDPQTNVIFRVEAATGRREEIVRPDFRIPPASVWVGWTADWDPLMLRDLGSDQLYRIDLDR
jgi:DNA-binding winged helix-turn-helix (wHTH) protein/Tol biopolymer transport system component